MARLLLASPDEHLRAQWQRALIGHEISVSRQVSPTEPCSGAATSEVVLLDLKQAAEGVVAAWHAAVPGVVLMAMVPAPSAAEGIQLLRDGVRGYCNRRMSPEALCTAVAVVLSGEVWAGQQVMQHLLQQAVQQSPPDVPEPDQLAALTAREHEVALGVASGVSSKRLAPTLGISERTVKAHLTSIYRKTGCRNRTQLALLVNQEPPSLTG